MEYKILSGRGRVKLVKGEKSLVIPPYPKLIHPMEVYPVPMVGELKWDGYNVRTLRFDGEIVSLLRGGRPDDKTRDMIVDFYGDKLIKFFDDNPNLILCGEVIGKKTMAGCKSVEFDYLIFDIMDLSRDEEQRFLEYREKLALIDKYGFNYTGSAGTFKDVHETLKWMQEHSPDNECIEGLVLKSYDGNQIFKLRYDMHEELFKDKIKRTKREPRKRGKDEIIYTHFMQGYPEEELGMKRGITEDEFNKLQAMIDKMYALDNKEDIIRVGEEMTEFLYNAILDSGDYDEEIQKKLLKHVKRYVAKQIGKAIKR